MNQSAWGEIVADLEVREVEVCVGAAKRLHKEADLADVPSLLGLLESDDFFVREAAAWPLAELAGPKVLGALLSAYERGLDEGLDNDGVTAALIEIPALHGSAACSNRSAHRTIIGPRQRACDLASHFLREKMKYALVRNQSFVWDCFAVPQLTRWAS